MDGRFQTETSTGDSVSGGDISDATVASEYLKGPGDSMWGRAAF